MLTSVSGRYLNGQIELYETVSGIEQAEVIVTFIDATLQSRSLQEYGFSHSRP